MKNTTLCNHKVSIILCLLLILVHQKAISANYFVTSDADAGAGTLRQAVLDANANAGTDQIYITNNAITTITLTSGELLITDEVSIFSFVGLVTISGNSSSRIFNITGGITVTLQSLSLQNGLTTANGGAIATDGQLNITNCSITNNTANNLGGGIYINSSATATLNNLTISGNSASNGAGMYINASATITMDDISISNNNATGGNGGGMYINASSTVTISNSSISNNTNAIEGGGIYFTGNSTITLNNITLSGNQVSSNGGEVYLDAGNLTLNHSTISNNTTTLIGGNFYINTGASLNATSCIITNGNANTLGGGIYALGDITLESCYFQGNTTNTDGAAIYTDGSANTSIKSCTFTANEANDDGGAIYNTNTATLKVVNCTFYQNEADKDNSGAGLAGAIYSNSSVAPVLKNNIVYANTANGTNDDLQISNATLAGDANLVTVCTGNCGTGVIDYTSNPNLSTAQTYGNLIYFQPQSPSDAIDNGITDADTPSTDICGKVWGTADLGNFALSNDKYYVKANATGANNGSSWTDAYTDLQSALTAAAGNAGSTIYVASGTYVPSIEVDFDASTGTDAREVTFEISAGTVIYGGFAGNEATIDQTVLDLRDFVMNETILSGDINGDDNVSGTFPSLVYNNYTENAYHVVYTRNVSNNTVLDGFTITGGNVNGNNQNRYGAGWYNIADGDNQISSLSIRNTKLYRNKGNSDAVYGVGMYNSSQSNNTNTDLTLSNVTIEQNIGEDNGSGEVAGVGLFNNDLFGGTGDNKSSLLNFTQVVFNQNTASADIRIYGVGLLNGSSNNGNVTSNFTQTTFSENIATTINTGFSQILGVGIFNETSVATANLTLTECTFSKNQGLGPQECAARGGAIWNRSQNNNGQANISINRCSFTENTLEGSYLGGAAIHNQASGSSVSPSTTALLNINNSLFWKNKVDGKTYNFTYPSGGALNIQTLNNNSDATTTIVNSTFAQNEALGDNPDGTNFSGLMVLQARNAGEKADVTIQNSIIWGNEFNGTTANIIGNPSAGTPGSNNVNFENSITESTGYLMVNGGSSFNFGTGVLLDTDPLFTDASNGDLTLQATSSAIDAGNDTYVVGTTDLQGNTRIIATVDMGTYEYDASLPIELLEFNAQRVNSKEVLLNWVTVLEKNNAGFEIQISDNGKDFQKLGFVEGQGNSSSVRSYEFLVNNSESGYYRLKQIDFDGRFEYSDLRFVEGVGSSLSLEIYPNPSQGQIHLSIPNYDDKIKVSVFNTQGKELISLEASQESINENLNHIFPHLENGLYIFKIQVLDKVWTERIILRR